MRKNQAFDEICENRPEEEKYENRPEEGKKMCG